MSLIKSKSKQAFGKNVEAEMHAGKPQKQSLAIAYSMAKRAKGKVKDPVKMAEGGLAYDPKAVPKPPSASDAEKLKGVFGAEGGMAHAEDSGYLELPEEHEIHNESAMEEADKLLNQHMAMGGCADRAYQKMSKGGMIANGGDDDLDQMADGKPNNFDDLSLRDDLEFSYTGANSGDELGDAQEDEDRHDMVARIMRSERLKDKLPKVR